MAIGTHQVDKWFASLETSLPEAVSDPSWGEHLITRDCFVNTVRNSEMIRFICTGPNYRRAVDDALTRAKRAFKMGDGAAAVMWLGDAAKAAR